MNMTSKQTFSFVGTITTVTPLAVSRPGDNFRSPGISDKVQRLPRSGPKHQDSPVFFPASTLNGAIRRAAVDVIRRATMEAQGTQHPFGLDAFYMLVQGVDTTQKVISESNGLIEEEEQLRAANPFLSLFGRWKLPGHIGIGDAIPMADDTNHVMYVTGTGARVNEWDRSPENIQYLAPEDHERLKKVLIEDALAAKDIKQMKDEIDALKKQIRSKSLDEDESKSASQEIERLEQEITAAKSAKSGASESIQRPLDGYECIAPQTVMSNKIVLTNATDIELGLFIHALAEFSRDPRLGAHLRQGAGEIKAEWEVKIRPVGSRQSVTVGKISLSAEEFTVEDFTDDKYLSRADEAFAVTMKNLNETSLDFTRYLKEA